jgi:class 3 adenylate cyclase
MKLQDHSLRYGYYLACAGMLELLHLLTLRPPTLISLLSPVGVLIGLVVVGKVVRVRQEWDGSHFTSIAKQQREHFFHEFFVYVFIALFSLIISRELLGLSLEEALLDTLFMLVLGYFASVEKTLEASLSWYRRGVQQKYETFRLIPVSVTLNRTVYSLFSALLLFVVFSIVQIYVALDNARIAPKEMLLNIALQSLFFLLMLGYLMQRIARQYTSNLHYILESQLKVVRDAQAGDYAQSIPLLTQGELGMMGMQLNRLIDYVRKRQDVESLLKRVVSPDIMEKLLSTDTEKLKRGEEREVAILFCDIRGFTEMSEGSSAADIIFFLNSFFSELSEIVSRNHGTINKFMGDAILAVYGGESAQEAIDSALNTANEITMRVRQMRLPNGGSPETGSGIHFGRVVAGTIGSEQRYEYTFLGDAVNTASRLQGLSKRFGYPIIVSAEAYEMLSDYLRVGLVDLGQHMVRGKAEALHIYGGPNENRE